MRMAQARSVAMRSDPLLCGGMEQKEGESGRRRGPRAKGQFALSQGSEAA